MRCCLYMGLPYCSHCPIQLWFIYQGGILQPYSLQYAKRKHTYQLDPLLYTVNELVGVYGNIFCIFYILCIYCYNMPDICSYARREVLKQRASKISRSLCETFVIATTETVSIASGNRLIQAVGNGSKLLVFPTQHIQYML